MRRVAIIGPGGAGKTTLAVELARRTGLPVVHLDRVYWRPGWTEPPAAEWTHAHREALRADVWIADGNFGSTMAERLAQADTIVLLDPPPLLCLWRVAWRSVWKRPRPDLPSGCDERPDLAFWLYVLRYRRTRLTEVLERIASAGPGKRVEILRSQEDVRRFLSAVDARLIRRPAASQRRGVVRRRGCRWHRGQNEVPRPATTVRSMGVPQRGQASPSRP